MHSIEKTSMFQSRTKENRQPSPALFALFETLQSSLTSDLVRITLQPDGIHITAKTGSLGSLDADRALDGVVAHVQLLARRDRRIQLDADTPGTSYRCTIRE